MKSEDWLPRGFQLEDDKIGKCLSKGNDWQLYITGNRNYAVAVSEDLYIKWDSLGLLSENLFNKYRIEDGEFYLSWDKGNSIIASVKYGPYPEDYESAMTFAKALKHSRKLIPSDSFGDALYFERYAMIIPTYDEDPIDDSLVLCRWLSAGVEISTDRIERLCEIVSWMPSGKLLSVIRAAGLVIPEDTAVAIGRIEERGKEKTEVKKQLPEKEGKEEKAIGEHFSLPGRPALEAFFNEHVIDIIRFSEEYKRMGIDFPSAVILHGPPGCGKTYAVERLVEFLGWKSYNIDSGSIGSPFIHDTSKKISEVFDTAIANAPSVIVIDEMEAFLSARNTAQASGQHHVEEVAEFLRRIPEATSKNVLVIAMTNLIESIDPAILRRGRFDHIIEVQMPSAEEVNSLLHHLTEKLPCDESFDYDGISELLKGHAMSDVTFVVKEAGRLAVKSGSAIIDNNLVYKAIDSLPKKKENVRKIGF